MLRFLSGVCCEPRLPLRSPLSSPDLPDQPDQPDWTKGTALDNGPRARRVGAQNFALFFFPPSLAANFVGHGHCEVVLHDACDRWGTRSDKTPCTGSGRWPTSHFTDSVHSTCERHVARCGRCSWGTMRSGSLECWTAATSSVKRQWSLSGTAAAPRATGRTFISINGLRSCRLWSHLGCSGHFGCWRIVLLGCSYLSPSCCLGRVPSGRRAGHAWLRRWIDQVWGHETLGTRRMELGCAERGGEDHGEDERPLPGPHHFGGRAVGHGSVLEERQTPIHQRFDEETNLGADRRDGAAPHTGEVDEATRRQGQRACGRRCEEGVSTAFLRQYMRTVRGRKGGGWSVVAPRVQRLRRVLPGKLVVVRREPRRKRLSH